MEEVVRCLGDRELRRLGLSVYGEAAAPMKDVLSIVGVRGGGPTPKAAALLAALALAFEVLMVVVAPDKREGTAILWGAG